MRYPEAKLRQSAALDGDQCQHHRQTAHEQDKRAQRGQFEVEDVEGIGSLPTLPMVDEIGRQQGAEEHAIRPEEGPHQELAMGQAGARRLSRVCGPHALTHACASWDKIGRLPHALQSPPVDARNGQAQAAESAHGHSTTPRTHPAGDPGHTGLGNHDGCGRCRPWPSDIGGTGRSGVCFEAQKASRLVTVGSASKL